MGLRLTCLCHPATPSMRRGRFPPADEALDPAGQASLLRLAADADWRRADLVLTSPLARASETAERLGLDARPEPALRDADAGEWTGCRLRDLPPTDLAGWIADPDTAPPGGESRAAVGRRIAVWLSGLEDRDGHVLAITHPSVLRAILLVILEAPPQAGRCVETGPLTEARLVWNGHWRLHGFGDAARSSPTRRAGIATITPRRRRADPR